MRRRWVEAQSATIEHMILIGITLVLADAAWSFVNSNASSALTGYNEKLTMDINQIKEKFVIVHVSFNYPQTNTVTVWLYNNGAVPVEITGVLFGTDETSLSQVSSFTLSPNPIPKGELVTLSFTFDTTAGTTYYVKVATKLGNTAITLQRA